MCERVKRQQHESKAITAAALMDWRLTPTELRRDVKIVSLYLQLWDSHLKRELNTLPFVYWLKKVTKVEVYCNCT